MYLRGEYWYYEFVVDGERYRGSTGFKAADKKAAEEAVESLKVKAREKHSLKMIWEQTKRQLVKGDELELDADALYQEAIKKTNIGNRAEIPIRCFCEWMKLNSKAKRLSDVTLADAQGYTNYLAGLTLSPAIKNLRLKTIKRVFAQLGEIYSVIENPFDKIKPFKAHNATKDAFTPEELKLIGENAKGWIYSLCLTAISTGLRKGDICLLKKSSVNLKTGWLTIKTRKTGAIVEIPILPTLRAHLEEKMNDKSNSSEYVFPELARRFVSSPSSVTDDIRKFLEGLGIQTQQAIEGYSNKVSLKGIHAFRHTFVYLAGCHNIPFPVIQAIVGHMDANMTRHYMSHANAEAKQKYLAAMPSYLGDATTIQPSLPCSVNDKPTLQARMLSLLDKITPSNLARAKRHVKYFLSRQAT